MAVHIETFKSQRRTGRALAPGPSWLREGLAGRAWVCRTYPKVLTDEQSQVSVNDPALYAAAADELADVLIYCLSLGNALEIDLTGAVLAKLRTNETRYPVDGFRGRFRKPERQR